MRITSGVVTARLLQQVQENRRQLAEAQQRASSGLRVAKPSDDPDATARIMDLNTRIEQNLQFQRNAELATGELAATEHAIASLGDVLQRARELATQASNSTLDAGDRINLSYEVEQLIATVVTVGNTRHAGRFLFAGHETATAPFTLDNPANPTLATYNGDTNTIGREISRGERVTTNITGDRVFPQVFADLIAFRDQLRTNNQAGISASVGALAARLDASLDLRSEVGTKMQRIEAATSRLADEDALLQGLLTNEQSVDLAQSLIEMQNRETTLQAALTATGRALNLNLLEFLR